MKRTIIGFIIAVMLISVPAQASETWYVSAQSGLNCRACPSITADVLTTYQKNAELEIIGVDSSGIWWECWDGVTQGWVHSAYLADQPSSGGTYIGCVHVTGYTPAPSENGGSSVNCFGEPLAGLVGQIVAVDPSVIPLEKQIYIEGLGSYETRDTGVVGNNIDVLVNTKAEAYALTGWYDVYIE